MSTTPDKAEALVPIEVYQPDLEMIQDTLNTVYHFCVSYDLFNQYKNLSNTVVKSPLTKQVQKASIRIDGIIADHLADQEGADDVS